MAKVYVNVCKKHGRLHSSVDAFGYLFASKAQARASESSTLGEEEKRQFAAFQQYVRSLVVVDESKPDDLDTSEAVALYSMIRSVSRFGRQGSACPPDPISVECANAVVSRYRQSRAQGLAHGGHADRWVFNNGRPFMQLIQIALYGRSKDVEEDADIWLLLMEDLASLSTQFISYLPHVDNTVNSLPHHFNSTMTDLSRHLVRHFGQDRSRELLSKVYPGDKVDELMAKATEVAGAQPRTSKLEVELPVTPPAMYSTLPAEEPQPEAAADSSATAEPTEATGFNPEDDNPFLLPFNRNKKLIIKQSLNTLMHVHTYDQPSRGGKNSPILAAYQRLRENLRQNNHVASPMSLARLVDSLSMVPGSIDKCLEVYTLAQYVIRNCCRPEEQMRHWLSVENAMLQAHCRLGFLEQAGLNRAQIINAGYAPNADSYGTMINYAKDTTDDALVARELFDESRRLGVKPTLFLYNTVISKLGKARKAEWAIELFKHMKAAGLTPTSVTYGAVIVSTGCTTIAESLIS
jgi:pentatricopeptide repeat protein